MKNIQLKILNGYPVASDETYGYFQTLDQGTILNLTQVEKSTGTIPMLRLWRMWCSEIAKVFAERGCTIEYVDSKGNAHPLRPFNAEDAHELFSMKFMGSDENGKRLSWKMGKDGAPKSKRLYAMQKLDHWATDNGIKITIPADCEYRDLCEEAER